MDNSPQFPHGIPVSNPLHRPWHRATPDAPAVHTESKSGYLAFELQHFAVFTECKQDSAPEWRILLNCKL
jgi:hypothetical protein